MTDASNTPSPGPVIAPLRGVRVLELGNYIAAPTAGRLLADFGAEVIKVERPGGGDEIRRWRLLSGRTSLLHRTINRNKKSVVIDLRSELGRRTVLGLVARVDAVVENFRPGTLEAWGLGPEVLQEANPGLILTRVSAYGQTGPLSKRPGFGSVAEAFGGLRDLVGYPDRPPVRVGVSLGDTMAGMYAAFGTVMALYQRATLGLGRGEQTPVPANERTIDVALHEAIFSAMEATIPEYSAYGTERVRMGPRIEGVAPTSAYLCRDGASVVIAGNGDSIFGRLMRVIGRPELAEDPALADNEGRVVRADELDAAIAAWTGERTAAEALTALSEVGVPAGPIYRARDIVADEQYASRDMVQYLPVSDGEQDLGKVAFPGITPVIGGRSLPIRNLGPELGADTVPVLQELLGLGPDQAAALAGQLASGQEAA
ncbi:CaiB/BaiF CoA transferase family protein [Enemella evansiae]|uniref:Formyl-CoA transferase n=1 Tax=Enemella evansiae TaxID=2016499 RepID=A0A255G8L0_9ACTN|nr:CoA transferase [Enemella evansiae]OYO10553.1 formyl-CoA transferase [Enemella evansiae]TDO92973.1 formyl-CoA transferase [Enemella evansiae]